MAGMNSPAFAPALVDIHEPGVDYGHTAATPVQVFNMGFSARRLSRLSAEEPQGLQGLTAKILLFGGMTMLVIPISLVLKELTVHFLLGWPAFQDNLTMGTMLAAFIAAAALLVPGAIVQEFSAARARQRWAAGIVRGWDYLGHGLRIPDATATTLGAHLTECSLILSRARLTPDEMAAAQIAYGTAVAAVATYLDVPASSELAQRMARSFHVDDPAVRLLAAAALKLEGSRQQALSAATSAVTAVEEITARVWNAALDRETVTLAYAHLEDCLV